jgi:hypothetical protein
MDALTGTEEPKTGDFVRLVLDRLLNTKVMGFLAIVALGMAIQELVFGTSREVLNILRVCQVSVFTLFLFEYLKSLWFAQNRLKFLISPSRIFDLVILASVVASFLPQIADRVVNTQALQVFRLAPILLFGYFGTRQISLQMTEPEVKEEVAEAEYFRLDPEHPENHKATISQSELLTWLSDLKRTGFYVCRGPLTQELAKVLASNSVPPALLANALSESSFPRSIHVGGLFLFSGAIPYVTIKDKVLPVVARARFVAVFTAHSILLVNTGRIPLAEELCNKMDELVAFAHTPIAFRAMSALFNLVTDRYEAAATELEQALRSIELTPLKKRSDDIYQTVYSLRRNLSNLKSDLWRINHLLEAIEHDRKKTVFNVAEEKDFFALLSHSTDYLYETFEQLEDNASALLDLRINMVSFEMNRFMGLLAVVTALGLIPTTISGFLGMNVEGTNFPITLANVAFITAMLIGLALYILRDFDWLKFR